MDDGVIGQIVALQTMPAAELKLLWRKLFDTEPPAYNRRYLVDRLTYRFQELKFGGLQPRTVARLAALAAEASDKARGKRRRIAGPISGTRLVREWKGVEHTVTVLGDGFEYQGKKFKSLSAIARSIAGSRWSGPLFFGLRRPGRSA